MKKFATALQVFAKTLAENTGVKATEVISKLYAAHEEGKKNHGFDIDVRIKAKLLLEICTVLGYYAASCGNCVLTFWDIVSILSSRVTLDPCR